MPPSTTIGPITGGTATLVTPSAKPAAVAPKLALDNPATKAALAAKLQTIVDKMLPGQ